MVMIFQVFLSDVLSFSMFSMLSENLVSSNNFLSLWTSNINGTTEKDFISLQYVSTNKVDAIIQCFWDAQ